MHINFKFKLEILRTKLNKKLFIFQNFLLIWFFFTFKILIAFIIRLADGHDSTVTYKLPIVSCGCVYHHLNYYFIKRKIFKENIIHLIKD